MCILAIAKKDLNGYTIYVENDVPKIAAVVNMQECSSAFG